MFFSVLSEDYCTSVADTLRGELDAVNLGSSVVPAVVARFYNTAAQSDTCYEPSSIACSGVVGHMSLSDMVGVTCCVGALTTPNKRVALARGVSLLLQKRERFGF